MLGRPLNVTEYLGLGAKYCRLNQDLRREAYAVYEKYSSWLESNNYYDSCDRTVDLLNRIRRVSLEDRALNNIRFDKIYIDGTWASVALKRLCYPLMLFYFPHANIYLPITFVYYFRMSRFYFVRLCFVLDTLSRRWGSIPGR